MSGLSPDGRQAGSSNGWPRAHETPASSAGSPVNGNGPSDHVTNGAEGLHGPSSPCTAAQLRRFIKSRPYVPMHELRRRFELNGDADEVTSIHAGEAIVYLGLQARESHLIEELIRQGEIGLELAYDPQVPIVVGIYPMRPISRG
jgi:hypothetical protein